MTATAPTLLKNNCTFSADVLTGVNMDRSQISMSDSKQQQVYVSKSGKVTYLFVGIQFIGLATKETTCVLFYGEEIKKFISSLIELHKCVYNLTPFNSEYELLKVKIGPNEEEIIKCIIKYDGNSRRIHDFSMLKLKAKSQIAIISTQYHIDIAKLCGYLEFLFCYGLSENPIMFFKSPKFIIELSKRVSNLKCLTKLMKSISDTEDISDKMCAKIADVRLFMTFNGDNMILLAKLMAQNGKLMFNDAVQEMSYLDILQEVVGVFVKE